MAKNVRNPLFTALTIKSTPQSGPESSPFPAPRLFEFKKDEVGEDVLPGDVLEMELSCVVKSIDDQGRISVNVTRAENCDSEDSAEEPKMVMTQESHTP